MLRAAAISIKPGAPAMRVSEVFAVQRMPVERGDAVFRPFYRGAAPPSNALDMILASVLARYPEG